ncbi:MAG: acyltransferase [Bacteroidales bacterium]|nr:acyltransferase [Bacteroidales bacterium]
MHASTKETTCRHCNHSYDNYIVARFNAFIYNIRGGWTLPEGIHSVKAYWWVQKITFSFMLEMFVFVSGYLMAYQYIELKKIDKFLPFLYKKIKRLIVPGIFFSILYFIFFYSFQYVFHATNQILIGCGHLWFLPMLFWCFIGGYFLIKVKFSEPIKLLSCLCLAVISDALGWLPFQMGNACYYLFFFYFGYYVFINKHQLMQFFSKSKRVITGIIIFLCAFVTLTLLKERILNIESASIITKAIKTCLSQVCTLIYATLGVIMMFATVNYFLNKKLSPISRWVVSLSPICFGVYIYQQFILKYLYYQTSLPILLGSYMLPIAGLTITLMTSIVLAKLSRKTRFGRFLIG